MIDGNDFIMYARDNDDDATVVTSRLRLFSCYRVAIIIILSCLLYTSHYAPIIGWQAGTRRNRTIKTILQFILLFYPNDNPRTFFASYSEGKMQCCCNIINLTNNTIRCDAKTSIFLPQRTTLPESFSMAQLWSVYRVTALCEHKVVGIGTTTESSRAHRSSPNTERSSNVIMLYIL